MSIPRRVFLLHSGTAVAGIASLAFDRKPAPGGKKPQVLLDALARMRRENKAGVALRLSSDASRHHPGHDLVYFLNKDQADSREMFAEIVFVCLEDAAVQAHLKGADSAHNLLAFDQDARVEAGARFDYDHDFERFGSAALELVHGPDNVRLKKRADELRRKADPVLLQALDRLGMAGTNGAEDTALLVREAPRIVPLLVQARLEAGLRARQEALRNVIEQHAIATRGSLLPYGISTTAELGGCGDDCLERSERVGVACGMALANANSRRFVRYLTQ